MPVKKRNNATGSWNGYNHQGKVGLLVALAQIRQLMDGLPAASHRAALAGWQLEYEHDKGEDFDIVDAGGRVVSRHQVKVRHRSSDHSQNAYKKLLGLAGTAGEKELRTFAIKQADGTPVPKDARFLHLTHTVRGGWSMSLADNPNCIRLYAYPDQKEYVDPAQQESLITFCMGHIALVRPAATDTTQQKIIFLALADALDAKIYTAHRPKNAGPMGHPQLALSEIYDIVHQNHLDTYLVNRQRELFYRYWDELRDTLEHEPPAAGLPDMDWDSWREADHIIQQIARDETFLESLKIIHPHKPRIHDDLNMSERGLQDVYFTVLRQVNKDFDARNHRFIRLSKTYALTAIENESTYRVAADIIDNVRNNNFRFETDYAINKHLSVTLGEIDDTYNIIGTAAPGQANYEDDRAKQECIMALKNIQFIKVDQAVELLKEQP